MFPEQVKTNVERIMREDATARASFGAPHFFDIKPGRDVGGTPLTIISVVLILFYPIAKGRRTALRPFSASSPTPGISNSDDEIAAGLGRKP